MWSRADVIGLFSNNVVSFSRNLVLSGLSFSLNLVLKSRMLSVRTIYVLSSLHIPWQAYDRLSRDRCGCVRASLFNGVHQNAGQAVSFPCCRFWRCRQSPDQEVLLLLFRFACPQFRLEPGRLHGPGSLA